MPITENYRMVTSGIFFAGIALPRALRENLTLTDLDLSYNGISSTAAINIFSALEDNYRLGTYCTRRCGYSSALAHTVASRNFRYVGILLTTKLPTD